MNYVKDLTRNRLDEHHLNCSVRVFTMRCMFPFEDFPFDQMSAGLPSACEEEYYCTIAVLDRDAKHGHYFVYAFGTLHDCRYASQMYCIIFICSLLLC